MFVHVLFLVALHTCCYRFLRELCLEGIAYRLYKAEKFISRIICVNDDYYYVETHTSIMQKMY